MASVPSESTFLLRDKKGSINSSVSDEDIPNLNISDQDAEFGLGTPVVPTKKSQKGKKKHKKKHKKVQVKSPLLDHEVSPVIELKDDLLTSFQTRALTESTGSLYDEVHRSFNPFLLIFNCSSCKNS